MFLAQPRSHKFPITVPLTLCRFQNHIESLCILFFHRENNFFITDKTAVLYAIIKERLYCLVFLRFHFGVEIVPVVNLTVCLVADDFIRFFISCKLLSHICNALLNCFHFRKVGIAHSKRCLACGIDSARKRNISRFHHFSHFQCGISIGRQILLIWNVSVLCIADNVFLRRNMYHI